MKDYYRILGVSEDASPEQIKAAYRKLARESHPDTNRDSPKATKKFKEINEAYEALSDSGARANYDAQLHGNHFTFSGGFGDAFDEIFGSFFSGGFGRQKKKRRQNLDVTLTIKLTFEEAALGCTRSIRFSRNISCGGCRGSGAAPNSDLINCQKCRGTGVFSHQQGFMSINVTCDACGGAGKYVTHPCKNCSGRGSVSEKEDTQIEIPCGVDKGSILQVSGLGHADKEGNIAGNLLIKLVIQASPFFDREDLDISSTANVPFTILALGGNLCTNTIHGKINIFVEPGTQSGYIVKTKGYGIRLPNGTVGSHFTKLVVKTPTNMNKEQIKALQFFQKIME